MSDKDQTPALLGTAWGLTGFASIFVGLRYICRYFYHTFWWDDFWMGVTLLLSFMICICLTVYAHLGGTKYDYLTPEQQVRVSRMNWISQTPLVVALCTGKLAIAALLKRLQSPSKARSILLWVSCVILIIWLAIQLILTYVQCRPIQKLWDPDGYPDGYCWSTKVQVADALAISAYLALMDLGLAAIGVHMIWNLQMRLRKKLTVCALLSTGVFAFAIAIVKMSRLPADANRQGDLIRSTTLLFIWNMVEINVVIIAGCIPTIVPVYMWLRGRTYHRRVGRSIEVERRWFFGGRISVGYPKLLLRSLRTRFTTASRADNETDRKESRLDPRFTDIGGKKQGTSDIPLAGKGQLTQELMNLSNEETSWSCKADRTSVIQAEEGRNPSEIHVKRVIDISAAPRAGSDTTITGP